MEIMRIFFNDDSPVLKIFIFVLGLLCGIILMSTHIHTESCMPKCDTVFVDTSQRSLYLNGYNMNVNH